VLRLTASDSGGIATVAKAASRRSNRTKPLIAVLLIVVVVLAGLAAYQQEQIAGFAVSSTAFQPCSGLNVWSDYGGNNSLVPVLLMQPNSTAHACVMYQTVWGGDPYYNFSGFKPFSYRLGFGLWSLVPPVCQTTCPPPPSNSFKSQTSPSTVQLTRYTNYVVVTYTISALDNSTGFYGTSLPGYFCGGISLVVGHPASQVNATSVGSTQCPVGPWPEPLNPVSLSVTGMSVTYLDPQ